MARSALQRTNLAKNKPGMLCTITIDLFKGLKKIYRHSCRLPDSPGRGVVFQLRISPRIRSPNQNGSKCSVRDLCQTDFCKNPRKSSSLPCPFKPHRDDQYWVHSIQIDEIRCQSGTPETFALGKKQCLYPEEVSLSDLTKLIRLADPVIKNPVVSANAKPYHLYCL
jgi:hypothetical protein